MYKSRRIDPNSTYVPDFDYNRDIGFGSTCTGDVGSVRGHDRRRALRGGEKAWEAMLPNFETLERNGFAVVGIAPKLGVRESRRIVGEVIVTKRL